LKAQIPEQDTSLPDSFGASAASICATPLESKLFPLMHQYDHPANVICSPSKDGPGYMLDAVIDWECAAVADRHVASDPGEP